MRVIEVEKLMDVNTNTTFEVATTRIVTEIIEKAAENRFMIGFDEQIQRIWTKTRIMVEDALIDIVGQDLLDNHIGVQLGEAGQNHQLHRRPGGRSC